MRLTRVLGKQHIDRMFKLQWKLRRRRVPIELGTENILKEKGIPLVDPLDVIKEKQIVLEKVEVIGVTPKPVPYDENHPLYHSRSCYEYHEKSALIEGIQQAQVLTNTVEIKQGLPVALTDIIESLKSQEPENINEIVQSAILSSCLFDAYQEKLPKIKDPLRPAFNFPRVYGIADYRRNRLITERLIELSNSLGYGPQRLVVRNAPVQTFLTQGDNLVRLCVVPAALLCGHKSLAQHADTSSIRAASETPLPDIFPLSPTISLKTSHFYDDREIYPITEACGRLQTAIFHFNETQVVNLHEEPMTEKQILGRSLLHTFTVALAEAKQKYGAKVPNAEPLPEPVTLQGIQIGGSWLHFTVLQLNSLNPLGPRNIFWSSPIHRLFSACEYNNGVPVLKGYNPQVFNTFLAFCKAGIECGK